MRSFLWLLALLAAAPALAQTTPPPTDAARVTTPTTGAADTIAALHRLFAARRKLRTVITSGLAVSTALGFALAATPAPIPHSPGFGGGLNISTGNIIGVGTIVASVPALGVELLYLHRYSRRREAEAVAAFQTHQLTQRLRRRLKPKYFRP